jgi:hypothetical protein
MHRAQFVVAVLLLTCDSIITWDVSTLATLKHIQSVTFAPDGYSLACVCWERESGGPYQIAVLSLRPADAKLKILVGPTQAGYLNGGPRVAEFNGPTDIAW